jgi:hypothetical protein
MRTICFTAEDGTVYTYLLDSKGNLTPESRAATDRMQDHTLEGEVVTLELSSELSSETLMEEYLREFFEMFPDPEEEESTTTTEEVAYETEDSKKNNKSTETDWDDYIPFLSDGETDDGHSDWNIDGRKT